MSVHKVPQDVEADDKLVGPFSFKQLVILMAAAVVGFIMILLARVAIFLIIIPMPLFLVLLFFGIYRRKDQSVETYVAAILRFYFKPRRRIWDKDGILETVIITAPKQVAGIAIDNMNTAEVKNRLKTLGQLMDTRGWSAKNASLQDGVMAMNLSQSDRLVAPTTIQEPTEVHDSDDMMDDYSSNVAQAIAARTAAMNDAARAQAIQKMQQVQNAPQVDSSPLDPSPAVEVHYQPQPTMQQSVIQPMSNQQNFQQSTPVMTAQPQVGAQTVSQPSASVMTTDIPADILNLSTNNDRSIESIAKEADKILESGDTISLHGR
jgi:hypothetical protein